MAMDTVKSKVGHGLRLMLVSVMTGANVVTILLLWVSCLSTHLDPATYPKLSLGGLLFPVFLVLNLAFVFFWLIISCRHVLLPIMGIIFCWNYVRDYCPINLQKKVPESACKIMSYNVVGFNDDEENGLDGYKTIEYISKNNADIIFLQECPSGGKKYLELAKRMTDSGYNVKANGQLRIYSKLPFVGETIYSESKKKGNGTFACMVEIKGDTVVLINNHLESNSITEKEKDDYSEALGFHDKDKVKASGRVLLSRLSLAATKRAEQTDSLCSLIRKYERYDMIVCGDMNDTPISYTYQQIANLLKNAYEESGTGLGISFNRKGFPVRIDHIFTSKGLKSARTFVNSKISSSDHRPIITNIYKNTETKQASNVPE